MPIAVRAHIQSSATPIRAAMWQISAVFCSIGPARAARCVLQPRLGPRRARRSDHRAIAGAPPAPGHRRPCIGTCNEVEHPPNRLTGRPYRGISLPPRHGRPACRSPHGTAIAAPPRSGPVAQWLELAAHNGLVAGSSPAGHTTDPFAGLGRSAAGTGTIVDPNSQEDESIPCRFGRRGRHIGRRSGPLRTCAASF